MNGIIEELLKENETDITDLNHLIYAAVTVIMEKVTKPRNTVKSRRNKNSWKILIQRKISNWRKELSILAESGPGPDNSKLNINKRKIFQKYKVTDPKEVAHLIENLKQKLQAKAQNPK
jgi:hypothetical protein